MYQKIAAYIVSQNYFGSAACEDATTRFLNAFEFYGRSVWALAVNMINACF